ncbi:hypothetical protein [Cellulomonas sp. URHE0023]|uniref:hypothetical protein n=1 Tax=Cellulomonas sp. URHE0023 TaxID=1380354 RepID=UPI00055737AD|nr:hypothetical protein [Cellulomonas sp. URHE0023]
MSRATIGDVVRQLWEEGARHGRPPEPTPEVDPWDDDDDLYRAGGVAAVVVFAGSPSITVRLGDDCKDVVTVEDALDFDVPRADTVLIVRSLLSGRARLAGSGASRVARLFGFGSASVTVPVDQGRAYTAQMSSFIWSAWLTSLPVEP